MRNVKFIAAILILTIATTCLQAGSLWLNGNDLYSSKGSRSFRPGDIITVIVSEESTAQSQASTNSKKGSSIEATTGPNIPLIKGVIKPFVGKAETSTGFGGQGTTTRSGRLDGIVTANVIEVFENGNILIEGTRTIRVNDETQLMRVRGIARSRDIDIDNSINSQLLADAQIKYEGQGSVGRPSRPGVVTRFFNRIF